MSYSPLLRPVIALAGWTLVMFVWMYARRLPAIGRVGRHDSLEVGGVGSDYRAIFPPRVQWPADNYNHLMEQPTVFYAVVLTLVAAGDAFRMNVWLAWGYVALRILHSIVQATVNRVPVRFVLFSLATLCLIALTLHAAMLLW